MQRSESFRLSAFLSFSGGLQDAYTYNVRDRVFANGQTGNVVLMSQSFLMGNWRGGLRYMLPLGFFILGILCASLIESRCKRIRALHWRQIVLLIEIALLTAVGFLPQAYNMAANILVSFACAMQVEAFRTVHGYGYASTMCIGNLRSGTESLSVFLQTGDRAALQKALYLFGIIFIFALGAGIGGVLCPICQEKTIWLSPVLLLTGALWMIQRDARPDRWA